MGVHQTKLMNLLIGGGIILLLVGVQANFSPCASYVGRWRPTPATVSTFLETPYGFLPTSTTVSLSVSLTPTSTPSTHGLQSTATVCPSTATLSPSSTLDSDDLIGRLPSRIRIPAIHVEAPVVPIGWKVVDVPGSQGQAMWQVPDWHAAGWHETSTRLGVPGNTVLNGHNTTNGEVFRDLYKLEPGALIWMDDENGETYAYRVRHVYILPEADQPMEVRVRNASYIQPTTDERLTLVTCHPYGSLRNRLVVIAFPDLVSEEGE